MEKAVIKRMEELRLKKENEDKKLQEKEKLSKIVNKYGLNSREESFANEYIKNGNNATAAFLYTLQDIPPKNTTAAANKLLKRPHILNYIELKRTEISEKEHIELSYIIKECKDIIESCKAEEIERDKNGIITSKPDRANYLKALDMLAKLMGYYENKKQNILIQSTGEINLSFGNWNPDAKLSKYKQKKLEALNNDSQDSPGIIDLTDSDVTIQDEPDN